MNEEIDAGARVLELSVTAAVLETALRAIVVLAGSHQIDETCARIYDIGRVALSGLQSSENKED